MYVFQCKCFKWPLGIKYNINDIVQIMLMIDEEEEDIIWKQACSQSMF